jgi:hypothetical protein
MDYVVYRAGHPSKLAYALPLLLLTFVAAIRLHEAVSPGRLALFALFCVSLVFTHHYTAIMGAIMLVALAVGQRLEPVLLPVVAAARSAPPSPGAAADRLTGRGHVLVVVFLVAFFGQFVYFSGFFDQVVSIGEQYARVVETYVDTLFVSSTGTSEGDATKQTPRFATIPVRTLLVNTVGSGLLAACTVLGVLDRLDRGRRLTVVLFTWFATAGVVMVIGFVLDVPFALPNRIYVIVEVAGVGVFAAVGLLYLYRRTRTLGGARAAVAVLLVLVVAFSFFSTASTIAGIETSPFNDRVGHNTWYLVVDEGDAEAFAEHAGAAPTVPAGSYLRLDGTFAYERAPPGTTIRLSEHRLSTGIKTGGGQGRIGSAVFLFPPAPRAGLANASRVYDNGNTELYLTG